MKQEIKQRWIDALRSGEYPQTMGKLRDEGGYCCLGVLCELAVEDGIIAPPTQAAQGWWTYGSQVDLLPSGVMDWAGLYDPNPSITVFKEVEDSYFDEELGEEVDDYYETNEPDSLAEFNDAGHDFIEIAYLIDEQL